MILKMHFSIAIHRILAGCGYEVTTTEGFDHERLRDSFKKYKRQIFTFL
jgi:hypothetical protein